MTYLQSIITVLAVFSMLTLSLNLQFGNGGIINFGLVAYFAVGAYTYAILTQRAPDIIDDYRWGFEWSPWAAIPVASAAGVVFAYFVGKPALRLKPVYLALATFAFAQMLESILVNVRSIGNGTLGLSRISPPAEDRIPAENYDLWIMAGAVLVAVAVYALVDRLTHSPFGEVLRATRDDDLAAQAIGKDVGAFQLRVFLTGAFIASLAGVVYASYTTVASPDLFSADVTFTAFIALVIGGLGRNAGAVVGAAIFFGLEALLDLVPLDGELAQTLASARLIPFGLALILVLRFAPLGLTGSIAEHSRQKRALS
jgi:branched-chain amino acid transport system permease protein